MDYSFLPNLNPKDQSTAIRLAFETAPSNQVGWDYQARYSTSAQYALTKSTFVVTLKAGSIYDIFSSSFFDPFILLLYNSTGSVVAADSGGGTYGSDMVFHFMPATTADYYISASWDQGQASSHRYSSVAVYEDAVTPPTPVAPAGPVVKYGTSGVDIFKLALNFDDYTVINTPNKLVLNKKSTGEVQTYFDVERLSFADKNIAYDTSGNAGQAYRLYEAAFNRTPDKGGLGYWIKSMDNGASLEAVSSSFLDSIEFKTLYGSTNSADLLITAMYKNVLNREPDTGGFAYWKGELDSGHLSSAGVLASFSESSENQIAVAGQIQSGIEYI